jgi:hypothetical protein
MHVDAAAEAGDYWFVGVQKQLVRVRRVAIRQGHDGQVGPLAGLEGTGLAITAQCPRAVECAYP